MKYQIAVVLLASAQLLGGCAADIDSVRSEGDHPFGSNTLREDEASGLAIAGRKEALWTPGCNAQQQGEILGATVEAYYALQIAHQTYLPGSRRAEHYFGVGYNHVQVENVLWNMWKLMHNGELTITCLQNTGLCNPNTGRLRIAGVDPDDPRPASFFVCDRFFSPNATPGESENASSKAGILLHEMAHLAGAYPVEPWLDATTYADVRRAAIHEPHLTFLMADAYRYYIFNIFDQ